MRRYNIVSGILFIFPIIDFVLAAPVLVQEESQAYVDLFHIPKDVTTMLGKRGSGDLENLVLDYFKMSEKPEESSDTHVLSSSAPLQSDHGLTNVGQAPEPNPVSSTANPGLSTESPSSSSTSSSVKGALGDGSSDRWSQSYEGSDFRDVPLDAPASTPPKSAPPMPPSQASMPRPVSPGLPLMPKPVPPGEMPKPKPVPPGQPLMPKPPGLAYKNQAKQLPKPKLSKKVGLKLMNWGNRFLDMMDPLPARPKPLNSMPSDLGVPKAGSLNSMPSDLGVSKAESLKAGPSNSKEVVPPQPQPRPLIIGHPKTAPPPAAPILTDPEPQQPITDSQAQDPQAAALYAAKGKAKASYTDVQDSDSE